jgi:hypothetical protein
VQWHGGALIGSVVATGQRQGFPPEHEGPKGGVGQGGVGRGSPGQAIDGDRGERQWLIDVLRRWRSPVAGEGSDEVLQLEEGTGR